MNAKTSLTILTIAMAISSATAASPTLSSETECGDFKVVVTTGSERSAYQLSGCFERKCWRGFRTPPRPGNDRFFSGIPICRSEYVDPSSLAPEQTKNFPIRLKDFPWLEYYLDQNPEWRLVADAESEFNPLELLDGKNFAGLDRKHVAGKDIGNIPIPLIPIPF